MNLIVFGATGQVGQHLIQQAIWKGYHVKAFGRNVFSLPLEHEHLEKIKGSVFDSNEIQQALKGCDAVLSVLGGAIDGLDKTRSLGVKHIVEEMQILSIKRIIVLGGWGILDADEHTLLMETEQYPEEFLPVGQEHRLAFETLKHSNTDWTFICSPTIINAGPTCKYKVSRNKPPQTTDPQINAGDLAHFMLEELERNTYVKQKVGISN